MKPFNKNLWLVICIMFMAYGCGSESGSVSAPGKTKQTSKAVPTTKGLHGAGLLHEQPGAPARKIDLAPHEESDADVVLPPAKPGDPGITRGEIKAMRARQAQVVESDADVVLPPARPGDPGITRGEIKAIRARQAQAVESDADVVLPPVKPGDPGITRGEIKAMRIKAAQAKALEDPKSVVVLPAIKPGDKGVTKAEIDARRGAPEPYKPVGPPPGEVR
jgi:hypothetical protein